MKLTNVNAEYSRGSVPLMALEAKLKPGIDVHDEYSGGSGPCEGPFINLERTPKRPFKKTPTPKSRRNQPKCQFQLASF